MAYSLFAQKLVDQLRAFAPGINEQIALDNNIDFGQAVALRELADQIDAITDLNHPMSQDLLIEALDILSIGD